MCHSRFQAYQRGASGSNCTGVSSGDQQKDHSALVARSDPDLICYQNAKPVINGYTKNMCHSGFQACQRDKAGSNSKSQLRCSFLKTLLLVWKVDVAELLFENASCSCLKPPITDSLLLSGSKEENILTAPFKSCWRPCRSSFQCPRSDPDLLPEC